MLVTAPWGGAAWMLTVSAVLTLKPRRAPVQVTWLPWGQPFPAQRRAQVEGDPL